MRFEDLPPDLRDAIEKAELEKFVARGYAIHADPEQPYFTPSTIVGGRSTSRDPRLDPFDPPSFDGDGSEIVRFWTAATGGADSSRPLVGPGERAKFQGVANLTPERASLLRNEIGRTIADKGRNLGNLLQEAKAILTVLLREFVEIDEQLSERLSKSTLKVPYRNINEARHRFAGGRVRNAWDMITTGESKETVDQYITTLCDWDGVHEGLLRAQRYGLQKILAIADPIRDGLKKMLGQRTAYQATITAHVLGATSAIVAGTGRTRNKSKPHEGLWMRALATVFLTQEGDEWVVPERNKEGRFPWQSIKNMIGMFKLAEQSDYAPPLNHRTERKGNAAKTYIFRLWMRKPELFPNGWPGPEIPRWYLTVQHWRSENMLQGDEDSIPSDPA